MPLFSVADDKLGRIGRELDRLADHLGQGAHGGGPPDTWSRTITVAFTVHGAYTGIEDVLTDIARVIDGSVPQGTSSHQALLEQMRAPIDGRRPAVLDDTLYAMLFELKGFRHLVRHHYGLDLLPSRTEDKRQLMVRAFAAFKMAMMRLEEFLALPAP